MKEIVFLSGAQIDLQAIYASLEESSGGEKFLLALDRKLALLQHFPALAPRSIIAPIRKLRIGRSPYGVFYAIEGNRIMIVAVQDLRQDPKALARTIRSRL